MIQLLVGTKGTGKAKALIKNIEQAVLSEKGDIVCITRGDKLNNSFDRSVRLVDVDSFDISSYKVFYGFLCGVISQNFDITHIFVDRVTRLVSDDLVALSHFINLVKELSEKFNVSFTITLSADPKDIPESIAEYSIDFVASC